MAPKGCQKCDADVGGVEEWLRLWATLLLPSDKLDKWLSGAVPAADHASLRTIKSMRSRAASPALLMTRSTSSAPERPLLNDCTRDAPCA